MNKNEKKNIVDHISNKNNSIKTLKEHCSDITINSNSNKNENFKTKNETINNVNIENNKLALVGSIPIKLSVELGNTKISIKDFLKLSIGSILPLDKKVEKSLNIYVNDCLIAKGEIVIIESKYGIRITEVLSVRDKVHKLE
ncbi:MAG: flagellar motor switch protein FliN [Buchnera aphidicola (Tetraneura akinire)]